jgi:hypothetical protein
LNFYIILTWEHLLETTLEKCDDAETYAFLINQKVKDNNLSLEQATSDVETLAMMIEEEYLFYLLCGIPWNDDWQFFLQLMMDKNMMPTLTPNEIFIKLVYMETPIKHENGLEKKALMFARGNGKEMPNEKEKRKAGRAGKVMKVKRLRIPRAIRPVFVAIRKGIWSGTARV